MKRRLSYSSSHGFTLIELLIVIAMISILTTMALPSFQNQIIRAQVQEAIQLSKFVREDIETFYSKRHRLPKNNQEAGVPRAEKIIGNYVEKVEVKNGMINIVLGNKINKNASGKTLSVRPALVSGEPKVPISWVYGYATPPKGMAVQGENLSTIPEQFLPINCRL